MQRMRATILLLAFLAVATRATGAGPHNSAFFLDPKEAVNITITDKGLLEHIDVVLSKQQVEMFQAYTRENAGQPYVIAYMKPQKGTGTSVIQLIWLNAKNNMVNGVLHLQIPNPNRNPQIIDPVPLPISDAT
jgi:hypothetical protein